MAPPDAVPPTPTDIDTASERIAHLVRRTPLFTLPPENDGPVVHLKLESLQRSGTFKARGASNALLGAPVPDTGIVAASGGNHGAAVAWACSRLGHPATIFVPSISAPAKIERLRRYGADVRVVGTVYADALAASEQFRAETGARDIHAYDDPLVMAGAGTLGRELEQQVTALRDHLAGQHGLDHVVVACGGGGLSGGLASWFGPHGPQLWVVETETTATFAAARAAGGPTDVDVSGLCADALGATRLGRLAFDALDNVAAESVLVDDSSVAEARRRLWDEFRLVVEPAAATTVAAFHQGLIPIRAGESVALILCGANTDDPF